MEPKREQWNSKMGFILAAIGSAVGLGNIWRYPYMVYSNGGGAFLIPYFVAIFTAGIPIVILEYGFGHKYRGSAPLAFARANKKYEWLGWLPSVGSFMILTYYTIILSWALNYVGLAFSKGWGQDTNAFFFNDFLKISAGPSHLGGVRPIIILGITLLWVINWFICFNGVSGGIEKLNKILLPTLVIIMIIIAIRGITLPGASLGLNKLFTPDWSKVMDPKVWISAYGQVFYSLSLAMGILITYSSYLPEKTDINNSALITAFANSGFEFLSAIGVFAILGYMATTQGVGVDEVATQGIGLAFVVFPKVFSMMGSIGTVFGVLFFLCLVFAGLTSCVSLIEAFSAAVIDKTGVSRKKIVTITAVGGYIISIIYTTGAGLYFLDIVDAFINSYSILIVGLIECIVLGWVIGAKNIREHNNSMSIYSIGKWWDVLIKYVTPIMLTYIIITNFINEMKNPYGGYPRSALMIIGGGILIVIVVSSIIASKRPWKKGTLDLEGQEVK
ncbi:MAG: sodium-dependent transporter [Clostridiaceae bacterium]